MNLLGLPLIMILKLFRIMSYIEREYDEHLERQDLVNECAFCLKSCKEEFCNQECELNYAIN